MRTSLCLSRECPHLRLCHAGDSEQEGRRAGLRSPARGPCRGRWHGPAPRAPAAADARSREAAAAAASLASAASAATPGGLGQGRPAGQTDRRHRSCHGGSLLRRGPCGSCLRSRELRKAAPDPVAGRVLGEWPQSRPLPGSPISHSISVSHPHPPPAHSPSPFSPSAPPPRPQVGVTSHS